MDPKYKVFILEHLPLIYEPAYKVKQENAEQLQILVKLLQRPDVDHAANNTRRVLTTPTAKAVGFLCT
ncbi:hypothetical protein Bt4C1_28285 (plasmid) [Bacillus thuringiensis serovar alesti]|nr:hypothetical protein Bt4C1_28285 [Bacillus thuringiensis serovar alesti]